MPLVQDDRGRVAPAFLFGASQSVNVVAASTPSAALARTTNVVRLCSTTDCWVVIGHAADASGGGFFLPAKWVEYVGVSPTENTRVAVRRATADGSLSLTEIS